VEIREFVGLVFFFLKNTAGEAEGLYFKKRKSQKLYRGERTTKNKNHPRG
jgi:hypothetical protein